RCVPVARDAGPFQAGSSLRPRSGGLVLAFRRCRLVVPVRLHLLVGHGQCGAGQPWRVSTAEARHFSPVSLAHAAFACRCPRCGEGRLFTGLLTVRPSCPACGLDLSAQDAGDGPAVFVILFLGLIVVGLAAIVEIRFTPPVWLHLLLWTP